MLLFEKSLNYLCTQSTLHSASRSAALKLKQTENYRSHALKSCSRLRAALDILSVSIRAAATVVISDITLFDEPQNILSISSYISNMCHWEKLYILKQNYLQWVLFLPSLSFELNRFSLTTFYWEARNLFFHHGIFNKCKFLGFFAFMFVLEKGKNRPFYNMTNKQHKMINAMQYPKSNMPFI